MRRFCTFLCLLCFNFICCNGTREGDNENNEGSSSIPISDSDKHIDPKDSLYRNLESGPKKKSRLKNTAFENLLGINAFEWDFLQDPMANPGDPGLNIYEPKMDLIKAFPAVRHYVDWDKIEDQQGSYTFNPTRRGGWNYDTIYTRCKQDGIFVVTCLQTTPDWLFNSYPKGLRDHDVIPAPYGSNRENPGAYIAQAKAAFQFAARYGNNKNVDSSLIHINQSVRWTTDKPNQVKVGLGLVHYIECGNEPDKWWKGKYAQQNGRQYAANLSAFYDGHKGVLGPGVGVKNADPTMKVVMGGLAKADVNFIKDMVEWCRQYRGLNKDGSVNLCFDVLNYHLYSNDNLSWFNKYFKTFSHGVAPELSNEGDVASSFMKMADSLGDMPVWCTEVGYDLDSHSVQRAVKIGDKSVELVQADWIVRTALLYARCGLDRVFFYQLYDTHTQGEYNGMAFGKSGLVASGHRRTAADYILQLKNLMAGYTYVQTINKDPLVDVYELNGSKIYVLVVPDQEGRTENHVLDLGNSNKATIYYLSPQSSKMETKQASLKNGKLTIGVSETPVFVKAGS